MLYTIASEQWSADRPLTPTQTRVGLYRTRDEAGKLAGGKPTLAVAVRYDATRGTVVATSPTSLRLTGGTWSAPAFVNDSGGVVALCPIPPDLVRRIGPPRLQVHPAQPTAGTHLAGRALLPAGRLPARSIAGRIAARR